MASIRGRSPAHLGQRRQERERLVADQVLRVVDVHTVELEGEPRASRRIGSEEVAQMCCPHGRGVLLERLPLWRGVDRNRVGASADHADILTEVSRVRKVRSMATLLGIDIGGTGIKGAPVQTTTGALVAPRFRIVTPQPATPAAVADVVAQIARNFEWSGPIGTTFPAVVKDGTIHTAANVDKSWIGTDAEKPLHKRDSPPVTVLNDADAAGVAEMEHGAGRGRSGVVFTITLGTGIGSSLFVDGALVANTELGHLEVRGKNAESRAADSVREREGAVVEAVGEASERVLRDARSTVLARPAHHRRRRQQEAREVLPIARHAAEVVPATLLNEAGIVGAAMAASRATPEAG